MNEKIKTQLREYLDLKLRLCKQYMREQDLHRKNSLATGYRCGGIHCYEPVWY